MRIRSSPVLGLLGLCLLLYCRGNREQQTATRPDSTLRVALESGIYTMDPQILNETTTLSVHENMFETLVMQDANLKVITGLAHGWETPDDHTWRIHLRRGVLFHDGSEMTSADVKFSYERVLAMSNSDFSFFVNSVDRVEIVDDYVVDIKLKKPYGVVATLGSIAILPAQYFRSHGEAYFAEHPVGTGPYQFVGWKSGEWVRLRAFDKYWGEKRPAFQEVTYRAVSPPEERMGMLERGEIDIAWMIRPRREPPSNYRVLYQPALHVFFLGFDCARDKTPYVDLPANPFRDRRVRQAFLYALNTDELIESVFNGRAYKSTQLVTPSIFGFNPAIQRPSPDLQKARALLAEAGYPGGFSATLDLPPVRRALAENLRTQYARVGIRLNLNVVPRDDFYPKIDGLNTSLFILGWSCSSGDASELFEYCLHTYDPEKLLGMKNNSGYSNPEVDRLVERSISTTDLKERLKVLQNAMVVVMNDLPLLPLYIQESVYGVSNQITYTPRLDDHVLGRDAKPND
ncbi:MAG: ABC transporter substrate-binding protein [Acidobacteriota bacterium]